MPVVRAALDHGCDVLLCTADVDEFTFQAMRTYEAKGLPKTYEDDAAREAAEKAVADGAEPEVEDRSLELKNVAAGDVDFATEDEKKAAEETAKANEDLFDAMKEALGDKVTKVTVSARLTDAPPPSPPRVRCRSRWRRCSPPARTPARRPRPSACSS